MASVLTEWFGNKNPQLLKAGGTLAAILAQRDEKKHEIIFPFWELLLSLSKINTLRVIAKKILRDFWEMHADCEQQLKSWFQEASKAEWKNPNEVKLDYPSASILNDNRIVFNIKGNNYRLIVKLNYDYQMIWIRFIGTHAEYDKINANEI